jgi:hypothetical protein
MRQIRIVVLASVVVATCCSAVFAQVPEPAPTVMGSGGGNSNDGTYYLSDTVGQPVIGISTDPANIIKAGFWYVPDQLHIGPTSAVAIATFAAIAADKGVELRWTIASADDLLGFLVYRSTESDGGFVRLTAGDPLPANTTSYMDGDVQPGRTYRYRIGAIDRDGEFLSVIQSVNTPHREVELYQNRPNPFNPSTSIDFYLPREARVTLSIYDVSGKLIRTLVDQPTRFGHHSAVWNGMDASGNQVSSGVYFYRLQTGKRVITKKMVVVK